MPLISEWRCSHCEQKSVFDSWQLVYRDIDRDIPLAHPCEKYDLEALGHEWNASAEAGKLLCQTARECQDCGRVNMLDDRLIGPELETATHKEGIPWAVAFLALLFISDYVSGPPIGNNDWTPFLIIPISLLVFGLRHRLKVRRVFHEHGFQPVTQCPDCKSENTIPFTDYKRGERPSPACTHCGACDLVPGNTFIS